MVDGQIVIPDRYYGPCPYCDGYGIVLPELTRQFNEIAKLFSESIQSKNDLAEIVEILHVNIDSPDEEVARLIEQQKPEALPLIDAIRRSAFQKEALLKVAQYLFNTIFTAAIGGIIGSAVTAKIQEMSPPPRVIIVNPEAPR